MIAVAPVTLDVTALHFIMHDIGFLLRATVLSLGCSCPYLKLCTDWIYGYLNHFESFGSVTVLQYIFIFCLLYYPNMTSDRRCILGSMWCLKGYQGKKLYTFVCCLSLKCVTFLSFACEILSLLKATESPSNETF